MCEQLVKVSAFNRNIGSYLETTQNLSILLASYAMVILVSIL